VPRPTIPKGNVESVTLPTVLPSMAALMAVPYNVSAR
jgi:hypothetical protein